MKYFNRRKTYCEIDLNKINLPSWARNIDREYLSRSIKERGIIKPIVLGQLPDGKLILIDGTGRYLLAKREGRKKISAIIIPVSDEFDALNLAIELEFIGKRAWDLRYVSELLTILLKKFDNNISEVARALKLSSREPIYLVLEIMKLPKELQRKFMDNEIPVTYAAKLRKLRRILPYREYEKIVTELSNINDSQKLKRAINQIHRKITASPTSDMNSSNPMSQEEEEVIEIHVDEREININKALQKIDELLRLLHNIGYRNTDPLIQIKYALLRLKRQLNR